MPYIGNDIQFGELTSQTFTGDGSTTAFTLSYTVANPTSLIVTIDNVIQEPTTAYTVSGTTLTCTSAPAIGDTIHVRYLGRVVDVANAAILQDSDQDTKVQVEESADEDTIRFDVAGTEVATIAASLTAVKNGALTLSGTTPTLTIGDAGAEDTKLVFDGNAQDYRIGLDDGTDTLEIGLGSAHGTTAHIISDAAGIVRTPLQSSFRAYASGATTLTDGSAVKLLFAAESYDTNADYATGTSRFTAPVDGRYLFNVGIMGFESLGTTDNKYIFANLYVNDAQHTMIHRVLLDAGNDWADEYDTYSINASAILKLDANDYVEVFIQQNTGANIGMNTGEIFVYFAGELLG